MFFKTAFVFDMSQTDPIPGVEPAPLQPPREPLTGDSHADLLGPLTRLAESLGYSDADPSREPELGDGVTCGAGGS